MKRPAPRPTPHELFEEANRVRKSENEGWSADVHPAWKSEIALRLKSINDGTAVLVDGDEHVRRLREKYGA